jgi:broad specificity phosphatase PhoE/GNAT superfamily N-acetyltransferase
MSGTRLILLRHGESNSSVQRIIGGPLTCTGLSALGRQQAERLGDRLAADADIPGDAVLVSSKYPRAIETAQAVADSLSARRGTSAFERIGALGEQFPGEMCDGMTFEAYVERFGQASWSANPYERGFPGGETVAAFQHRVAEAVMALATMYRDHTVVISCHGGVVDRTMRLLLHTPPTGLFELHTLNCSITEFSLVEEGVWRLHRYNDVAHLAGLPDATERLVSDRPLAGSLTLEQLGSNNIDGVLALSSSTGVTLADTLARSSIDSSVWRRAATVEGRVVGFAAAVPAGSARAPEAARDGWYLWHLVIDQSRERTGYGRRVVELAHGALGDEPLYLSWGETEHGVASFAKALGFEAFTPVNGIVVARRTAVRLAGQSEKLGS